MDLFAKSQLRTLLLSLSCSVAALAGCDGGTEDDDTDGPNEAHAHFSSNGVFLIDANLDGVLDATVGPLTEVPGGDVRVVRYEDSVSVRADLAPGSWMPGEVLTLWWVFFNNPENCKALSNDETVRCGIPDLNDPMVAASLVNAGAGIVAADGSLSIGGGIKEGDTGPAQTGMGLMDASKADIHIVWRAHGQATTATGGDSLVDQLTTFNGGCGGPCANVLISAHESDDVEEHPGEFSTAGVNWWDANMNGVPDFKPMEAGLQAVAGSYSSVLRDADGVDTVHVFTDGEPGEVLTLWLAIFNDPTKCKDGSVVPPNARCGLADLNDMEVSGSLVNVAGGVVREDGSLRLGGRTKKGDTSVAATGMGLLDPLNADIHLVLRRHGQLSTNTATAAEQLRTFNGGCDGACPNYTIVPHEHEEEGGDE